MLNKVVVTGLGMVTPVGANTMQSWDNLLSGMCGIDAITIFSTDGLPCKIAAEIKTDKDSDIFFDESLYVSPKDRRKIDRFILYGIAASDQAVKDSGWVPESDYDREMTSVIVGSGIGGLPLTEDSAIRLKEYGFKKISPFTIPGILPNLLPGHIAIRNKYFGVNMSIVTACASGSHAIGNAFDMIRYGKANVVLAGGAEAALTPLSVAGFGAGRALSTGFNDNPKNASRPWDRDRDGFVIGEGAGMIVLENYEHAKRRGAKIYAELSGYGFSCDAYHITAPSSDGAGAVRAMSAAIKDAGISVDDIGYINAHGTSTPIGDEMEINAILKLFNVDNRSDMLCVSSTKSLIGHLLGAAGGVEAVVSILSLINNIVHPTINLYNPIIEHKNLDLIPHKSKEVELKHAMSNSFGFGGTNACLVFSKNQ